MYTARFLFQFFIIALLLRAFTGNKEKNHTNEGMYETKTKGSVTTTTKNTNENRYSKLRGKSVQSICQVKQETSKNIVWRFKRNNKDEFNNETENKIEDMNSKSQKDVFMSDNDTGVDTNLTIDFNSTESNEIGKTDSTNVTTIYATTQETVETTIRKMKKSRTDILKELQNHTKSVDIKDHPYMVSIQREMMHSCCGTIVSNRWVLTAAHCLTLPGSTVLLVDVIKVVVVAGQSHLGLGKMQLRRVKNLYIHSSFGKKLLNNNIGMIQLFQPFALNDYVNVVHLSTPISKPYKFFGDCYVTSWTVYRKDFLSFDKLRAEDKHIRKLFRVPELQMIYLPTITIDECLDRIKAKEFLTQRNHICTEYGTYKNVACVTDAGSPLICGDRQYGIFSWGIGCDDYDYPGVFTNVASFRKWINYIGAEPFDYISRNEEETQINFGYSTFFLIEICYLVLKSIQ